MAVAEVHPVPIDGPWIEGFVLDRHVISAVPIGYRMPRARAGSPRISMSTLRPPGCRSQPGSRKSRASRLVSAVGPVQCEWCLGNSPP